MALGRSTVQPRFENPREILGDRLAEGSIYRLLADHGQVMFPDDYFADCYTESKKGRPTIPARVLATVMVLQAFEGLSDREATDRLELRPALAGGLRGGRRLPRVPSHCRSSASATGCGPRTARGVCSKTPRWWPKRPGR